MSAAQMIPPTVQLLFAVTPFNVFQPPSSVDGWCEVFSGENTNVQKQATSVLICCRRTLRVTLTRNRLQTTKTPDKSREL